MGILSSESVVSDLAYNLVLSNLFKAVWSRKTINLSDLSCPF